MSFDGKNVIVTGATRGIGLAIAKRFVKAGAFVHIIDNSIPEPFGISEGDLFSLYKGDVSSAEDVRKFIAGIRKNNVNIDVLVNNAGIIRDNVIWKMPEEDFDKVLEVNLKGCWLLCKEIAPVMREQMSGRIINIVSRAWLGNPGQSNYSASKGGLVSMTRVLALELASKNITVNAVAPGLIKTSLTDSLPDEVFQKLLEKQPSKQAGEPDDVAAAVMFLASDEAGFINGQVLHVDGGRSIGSTIF
jgi:NAD(P)-dependent dehydrogenase (short-subunit alcohol dehydrogenase family)